MKIIDKFSPVRKIVCDDLLEYYYIIRDHDKLLKDTRYIYGVDTIQYEWIEVRLDKDEIKDQLYLLELVLDKNYEKVKWMFDHCSKWYHLDDYGRIVKLSGLVITNADYYYEYHERLTDEVILQDTTGTKYLNGWIDIKDKMPKLDTLVYILIDGGNKIKAKLIKGDSGLEYFKDDRGFVYAVDQVSLWKYYKN